MMNAGLFWPAWKAQQQQEKQGKKDEQQKQSERYLSCTDSILKCQQKPGVSQAKEL